MNIDYTLGSFSDPGEALLLRERICVSHDVNHQLIYLITY